MLRTAWAAGIGCLALLGAACQPGTPVPPGPVVFDTASVWIRTESDSVRLRVEIARTVTQHERGLSGRPSLDRGWGMLFQFDDVRSADEGFWMWGTRMPLDIAFMDRSGVILRVASMDVCDVTLGEDACPGHFAGVDHSWALEVNQGWFAEHGVRVGSRVRVVDPE